MPCTPIPSAPLSRLLLVILLAGAWAGCGPEEQASPVGTYRLDRRHFMAELAGAPGGATPDQLLAAAHRGLILEIHQGGTWRLRESGDAPDPVRDEGTWTLDGNELILDYTVERSLPNVRRVRGTFIKGVIEYKPMPGLSGPLRFVPPGYRAP